MNRNDKCSCGSGLKFKKCCLNTSKKTEDQNEVLAEQQKQETLKDLKKTIFEKQMAIDGYFKKEQELRKKLEENREEFLKYSEEDRKKVYNSFLEEVGLSVNPKLEVIGQKTFTFDEVIEDVNICCHDDGILQTTKDYFYKFGEEGEYEGDYLAWSVISDILLEKGTYDFPGGKDI